jgi:hypothetical protein
MKLLTALIFIFFVWVTYQQHQSTTNATPQQLLDVQMETRARNILAGGYIGE